MIPPASETWLYDPPRRSWRCYRAPATVLTAHHLSEVGLLLDEIERAVQHHALHAVGYLAYDAAPAFDASLTAQRHAALPLAWFGLFTEPRWTSLPPVSSAMAAPPSANWTTSLTRETYTRAIIAIREAIAAGLTYQVNFTFRLRACLEEDPWFWFLRLIQSQPRGYGAFLPIGDWVLCSASPELLFELEGDHLVTKPMKGTAPRGLWSDRDARFARDLRRNPKTRAENVMIVDMARNDLGRIAEIGTVRVTRLFEVERHPTVLQMTSTVTARSRAPLRALFEALFPAASITGAPKPSTMQLIARLEDSPRGPYTGAIGVIEPGRRARFNVAIRTLLIHRPTGTAEYGTGGGIVWDSLDHAEFEEALAKAAILNAYPLPPFSLLETLRWTPSEGFAFLEGHLARLAASARYFAFPCVLSDVRAFLTCQSSSFPPRPQRVRLLLSPTGQLSLDHQDLQPLPIPWRLGWARSPVNPEDPLLYHKTTHRTRYEEARRHSPDTQDVLLWNSRGELTESTIANLFVEIEGLLLTPPVASGLLPGVLRAELIRCGRAAEAILRPADLRRATRIFLGNALRGLWPVTPPADPAPTP
jgi:para-aminobenzoate synthetase/4-amino-4-deoxychorismate lyase